MQCVQARQMIERERDGELDAENARTLRQHLAECPECMLAADQFDRMRSAIREGATYFRAPPELRRSVAQRTSSPLLAWLKARVQVPWWGLASSLASAAALSVAMTMAMLVPQSTDAVAREILSNHVRSLMVDHLADVTSTDQHTVKPWFTGKLDFSPPVQDLSSEGFALLGGRLDYVEDRPVAGLGYQRNRHRT